MSTSMEGGGRLAGKRIEGHQSLRYARCPPSRNHVSVWNFKQFAALVHAIHSEGEYIHMPLVSMRQLLDEAAKGGYGVGAFNVNNMEQIQSIMEAARETKSPVIIQASRGARAYSQDRFLYHLMIAATEVYPEIPDRAAPRPRQQRRDLQERHRHGLHQRHDGRLADGRRQDAVQLRIQREGHARSGRTGARQGRHGGRRNRLPRRHRRRPRRGRRRPEPPDRSRPGGGVREADRRGRAGHRHRHQPRRLQVQQQADRRDAEDGRA